jgi:hypothetical protein
MLHGLVGFLIFALVVLIIAWIVYKVVLMIPGLPPPAAQIVPWIIGLITLIAILDRGLPLLGMGGVF